MPAHRMKSPLVLPTKKEILAYAAGLIDGEGWIGITKTTGSNGNPSHFVKLRVANCNVKILEWLHDHFGGAVHSQGNLEWRAANNTREGFNWEMNGRDAAQVLRVVRPFMVGKVAQADIALKLDDLRRENTERYTALTAKDIKAREKLKDQMHALNKRGL